MTIQTQSVLSDLNGSADFFARLSRKVVFPSDSFYDEARLAWNRSVDQHPALIVFPENASDVIEAVLFARDNDLPVAVQATGHGVLRKADGAVLINTSRMKGLTIDPKTQIARIEAGVKWGEVLEQAQEYGLAPLLGSSPDVGAIGYTLGGGMGWLARKYGLGIDSVRCMDVVTPDGILRTASPEENPDLFWALRGGGGGFGVVTAMEVQLYPVAQVYAGNLYYPPELAREVFARFNHWISDAPDELTTSIALMNFPPLPVLPEFLRGKSFVIMRGAYAGPAEEGEKLLSYWRDWQAPLIDNWKSIPFSRAAEISNDPVDPLPDLHTGGWLRDLSPETVDTLVHYTLPQGGPPALVMTEVRFVGGGAIARVDPSSSAYSHRDESLAWISMAFLMTPDMEALATAHFEQMRAALGSALVGKAYMNFLSGEESIRRTSEGFSEGNYQRLQEIKAKYDPEYRLRYGYDLRKARV